MSIVDVVGHKSILESLAASASGDALFHAYLFSGPPLVGKGQAALWLAQLVNCLAPGPRAAPCGKCSPCLKTAKRTLLDLKELFPDGKARAIKVDSVRELSTEMMLSPLEARRKFSIIHEADRMNESAANALLKTLEEPPRGVVIVLTASNPNALPPTIVSRCRRVRFLPVDAGEIEEFLVSSHGATPDQAATLAALSGGRPGQALRFMQDKGLLELREKTFKVLEALPRISMPKALDAAAVLEGLAKDSDAREKVETILDFFLTWFRDLVGVREGLPASLLINRDRASVLNEKAHHFTRRSLDRGLNAILESRRGLSRNVNPRLMFQNLMLSLIDEA